ncbi:hypothetical protein ACFO5R_17215 [Halosolutus amylolyticus]|uniref:Uncharacterized protein n=1 Tax=Halosolutus amylolyticus TaxID=2932267 RepID=A0ABD5PTM3_9EURY|nr:hypothetical protein [Halosolutus amylolyticus]
MWNAIQEMAMRMLARARRAIPSGGDVTSRLPGRGVLAAAKRRWKRHVTERPDRYQAYVSFPTDGEQSGVGDVHDCIEDLEHVFEGRLDVYARTNGIAVVSDRVSAAQFDRDAFERAVARIEDYYAETHTVARLEKWRPGGDRLVKSFVIVPVKPLFPHESSEKAPRVRSAAE